MNNTKLWLLASALAIAGCTVGPDYHAPQAQVPAAFDTGSTTQPATQPSTQPAVSVDVTHWWRSLNDTELDSLVDRAVAENLDLSIALARLQQARAAEFAISGVAMPFVEASGAAARGSGNNSVKGRIASPLNAGTNTAGLQEITEVIGFDAGWELDLFGRFRRQREAAVADRQTAAEYRNGVIVTLVSDVARAYFELRSAQARLTIANENIDVVRKTLDVVQQRFDRGLTNELDAALAKRQLATQKAVVAPLEASITEAQRRLAILLGQTPESLYAELNTATPLPDPPVKTVIGLPVDLLRRRPDIREAERRLAAENARIGVAVADLFPRVAVTAGYGFQQQDLGRNPVIGKMIWSLGPTFMMPLLDFGRIDSMIELQDFRTKEQYYTYRKTVLTAVKEVDDAVANYNAQRDRLTNLDEALAASKRAVELATGRYERGLIDFLNVLDAQRQLYILQDQYTLAQEEMTTQYVAVYKSLGGGWEPYQDVPDIRKPLPAILAAGEYVAKNSDHKESTTQPAANP